MTDEKYDAFDDDALTQKRLAKKPVTIYVWHSMNNLRKKGEGCGHVSIQLPDAYLSFWPKQAQHELDHAAKDTGKGLFTPIELEWVDSLEQDLAYETAEDSDEPRQPETIIRFYTLHIEAMLDKADQLLEDTEGWCLTGLNQHGESCVSFASKVLDAGGMGTLVSKIERKTENSREASNSFFKGSRSTDSQKASFYSLENTVATLGIQSPDALVPVLHKAKQVEWERQPVTQALVGEDESLQPEVDASRGCAMM